jgi:hypothetical protein
MTGVFPAMAAVFVEGERSADGRCGADAAEFVAWLIDGSGF